MSILSNFTVVDLVKTRSDSVATLYGSILKFNNQTAAELHHAPYIQILINAKDKQFAIRPCKVDTPNAIAFSKPAGEQKYQIKISAAAVVDMIRKMAGWDEVENWNVPGIYFADENVLIYDCKTAYKPSVRGGWTAKKEKEAAAAAAAQMNSTNDSEE